MIRSNTAPGSDIAPHLIAFAHPPLDARSACIAAIEVGESSAQAVTSIRSVAAPVVFAIRPEGLEWWQQGETPRRIGPLIPPNDIPGFFSKHQSDFSPDGVYRAKTWGRFDQSFQRSFVDLGLMPLVEAEIGNLLQGLISRNVQSLKSNLGWDVISDKQGAWLLKSVFWLVSAKILHDKNVSGFGNAVLTDVDSILDSVGDHFGAQRIAISTQKQRAALREIAMGISSFSSLELATTESLAHVYENTMISKATRQALGTHSTPSYLVDYIVGRLTPWIQEIDPVDRNVFEPACGHAAFLVSAMRLLTELHPDGQSAQKRRSYLRQRIHGCEVDGFALEIARLSLSLTDIPNPNGWDLHLGDMFVGDTLESMASNATILLANPPFENFKPEEKAWYTAKDVQLNHINKTTEMLSRVLPALPGGAVIGLVVPQGFLHSKNSTSIRRLLLTEFELDEICLFPDKVFTFSDIESSVLIARKSTKHPQMRSTVRYRRVRESDISAFRLGYAVTSERYEKTSRFLTTEDMDLRVIDLENIWQSLSECPMLSDVATVGKGLQYMAHPPKGMKTISEETFPEAVRGFSRLDPALRIHEQPREMWMSLDPKCISARRHGAQTRTSQVIFNEVRTSRGCWRLKAFMDEQGHALTGSFNVARSNGIVSSEWLWAVLNSPIANALAFCSSNNRHNQATTFRAMRIPDFDDAKMKRITSAARNYLTYVRRDPVAILQQPINSQQACTLLLRVDCEVLKLYNLPRELERQLLDYFAGWQREGVPFKFDRYFPEHFTDPISLSDYLAITADWPETNKRRAALIRKKVDRTIDSEEREELKHLQSLASSRKNLIAPLPLAELERLHREVVGETE